MTSELPWLEPLQDRLAQLVTQGGLPHAILLSAAEGWGDRQLAQWLAMTILTVDVAQEPTELAHPDLRWVVPDGQEIKVDAVRGLQDFAFSTPQLGMAKVIVFEDAHLLNVAAANALLKTLEEPPAGTFVVLASCHAGRLLPTIRSRCQRFHVASDHDLARRWLAAAIDSREQDAALEQRLYAHGYAPLPVAEELSAAAPPLGSVLQAALAAREPLGLLDDLLAFGPATLTAGWYRLLKGALAGRTDLPGLSGAAPRQLVEFADELLWVRGQLLNSNSANAKLLVERLTSRWHQLGNSALH